MSRTGPRAAAALAGCGLLVAVSLTSCAGSDNPFADGCAARVRYHGQTYVDVGFSSQMVEHAGKAAVVACARDGERGARADVWRFPGRDPRKVLAVHLDGSTYRVLVATSLPASYTRQLRESHLMNAGGD